MRKQLNAHARVHFAQNAVPSSLQTKINNDFLFRNSEITFHTRVRTTKLRLSICIMASGEILTFVTWQKPNYRQSPCCIDLLLIFVHSSAISAVNI